MIVVGLVMFFSLTWFMSSGSPAVDPLSPSGFQYETSEGLKKQGLTTTKTTPMGAVDFGGLDSVLTGGSIAPKLGNETLRYVRPLMLAGRRIRIRAAPSVQD